MHIALQSPSPWLQRCRQSGLSWRCALQSAPSDTPSWSLPWWCAASMHASGTRSSECVCRCLDPQSASSGSPCNSGSPAPSDRCMPASSPWRWWCPAPHASLSEQVASCCLACCFKYNSIPYKIKVISQIKYIIFIIQNKPYFWHLHVFSLRISVYCRDIQSNNRGKY